MKKIILTCLAMAAMFAVSAQIEKGTVLVATSTAFGYTSETPKSGSSTKILNLDLKGGYFVIDNLAVGLNVNYLHFSTRIK